MTNWAGPGGPRQQAGRSAQRSPSQWVCLCPPPDLRAKETESYRGEVAGPGPQEQEAQIPACGLGHLQGAGRLSKALTGPSCPAVSSFTSAGFDTWKAAPAQSLLAAAGSLGLRGSPPLHQRPLPGLSDPSALQGRRRAPAACGDSPKFSPVICHRFPPR